MPNEIAVKAISQRGRTEWRDEFVRLVGRRGGLRPVLVFLPSWWRDPYAAFAYFNVVAVGPALPYAPSHVRNYVLAHELGHIRRRHTASQVVFWLCAVGALTIGPALTGLRAAQLVSLLILCGSAWILFGETRREFQADDMVATLYDAQTLADGLRWMQSQRHRPASKLYIRRLDRAIALERKAT